MTKPDKTNREIDLKKRSVQESVDYLLEKGLMSSGSITRACLSSMALLVTEAHKEGFRKALESEEVINLIIYSNHTEMCIKLFECECGYEHTRKAFDALLERMRK